MEQEYNYIPLSEPIPITDQVWTEGTLPLVCTSTLAYNHEPYIRECLDGILMQKTTFPVQVLVHEDCSTDRTAEILKEYQAKYPNLIKVFYEPENVYSLKDPEEKRKRLNKFYDWRIGKYIALCEGDDYWIDPLKLQKQVDFLEANKDFSACVHQTKVEYQNKYKSSHIFFDFKKNIVELNDLIGPRVCHTASLLAKNDVFKNNNLPFVLSGDRLIFLMLISIGKIRYINECMAIYRKNSSSLSHSVSINQMKQDLNMIPFLVKIIPSFPKYRYLSFLYYTIAFYSINISINNKLKYALLSVFYSFSFFPGNIIYIYDKITKGKIR